MPCVLFHLEEFLTKFLGVLFKECVCVPVSVILSLHYPRRSIHAVETLKQEKH